MSTTVTYKGETLTTATNQTRTLETAGTYLEDDITLVDVSTIPTGTKNISITANGTTTEDVTNYATASITANVPNTYTAGDEGKVVDSGALVSQTAHADVTPTTSDQTIDTTTNNSIKVKGDADLVAGNIKKDVEIFGVTGSYEGGGSGGDAAFQVKDFKVMSTKWVLNQTIPNVINTGGCVHMKMTVPVSPLVSSDQEVFSFGADALTNWSSTTNCLCLFMMYNNGPLGSANYLALRLRGSSLNDTLRLHEFYDANNAVDLKFYKDKLVDVNTGTTILYSSSSTYDNLITAMTKLCTYSYISVGRNQSNTAATGDIIELFAIEPS